MEVVLAERTTTLVHPLTAGTHQHVERVHFGVWLLERERVGFGAVSVGPSSVNGDPSADEVRRAVLDLLLPRFRERLDGGGLPWSGVATLSPDGPAGRAGVAAFEMALLDFNVGSGEALEEAFPPQVERLVAGSGSLLSPAYIPRDVDLVRLKVGPEVSTDTLRAVTLGDTPLILDFNGTALSVSMVHELVQSLNPSTQLRAVEQPFAVGDFATSALLRSQGVPVSLDESLRTIGDIRRAVRYEAVDLLCLKPPRFGGLAATAAGARVANQMGVPWYLGGMFDLPRVRAVHGVFARHLGAGPSDVSGDSWDIPDYDEWSILGRWQAKTP